MPASAANAVAALSRARGSHRTPAPSSARGRSRKGVSFNIARSESERGLQADPERDRLLIARNTAKAAVLVRIVEGARVPIARSDQRRIDILAIPVQERV